MPPSRVARIDVPSTKPLLEKLGWKPGGTLGLLGAPAGWERVVGDLPAGLGVTHGAFADVTLAFVRSFAELDAALARWPRVTPKPAPSHWVCWPKKTSPLAGEVTEDHVRNRALAIGLMDNKVCRVDDDWSALRIAVRRS
jgi:hypothetical protein